MVVVYSAGSVTSTVVGKTIMVEVLSPLSWNSVVVDSAITRGDDVAIPEPPDKVVGVAVVVTFVSTVLASLLLHDLTALGVTMIENKQ